MLSFIKFYQSLGKFSRWEIGDIFLIFPRKQDLTLMQIVSNGDNLHVMSKPVF